MRQGNDDRQTGRDAEYAENTDDALVVRAKTGDQDAFGELVRRHRARAYGFAYTATRDAHLADDIVQDALVSAFLRLASLVEPSRFGSWLQRIVRNQAYMRLRRGGPYGRERPLSGCSPSAKSDEVGDPEAILYDLLQSIVERHDLSPEERFVREETLHGLQDMLHCLSPRERAVFEAHFYRQLETKEIAALLCTSVANVHNQLSRSRVKLRQEKIRIHVAGYVQNRRALCKPVRRILDGFGHPL